MGVRSIRRISGETRPHRGARAAATFVVSLGTVVVGYLINLLTNLVTASWTRDLRLVLPLAVVVAVVVAGLSTWLAADHLARPSTDTLTASTPAAQNGHMHIGEVSGGIVIGQANGPVGPGAQQINVPGGLAGGEPPEDPRE